MSQFQACRACGATMHASAPACPQCGAPANAALGSNAPHGSVSAAATTAPSIPWFRKRWFAVLCMITITPIASLLALTGDVYYKNKAGSTMTLPKNYKTAMMLGTFPWLFLTFGGPSQMLMPSIALLFVGAVIAFKK